jgi:L-threonine kinase
MKKSIEQTAELLKVKDLRVTLSYQTALTDSKGMGSSTADILAAAVAFADTLGKKLSSGELGQIAASIESSDGTMYPGITAVNQKTGKLLRRFSWWPEFHLLIAVPEQKLDTEAVRFDGKQTLEDKFSRMLDDLDTASREKNEQAFADAALESAALNQEYVRNELYQTLVPRLKQLGALGINVAHTGTMVGLLFTASPEGAELAERAKQILRELLGSGVQLKTTTIESQRVW